MGALAYLSLDIVSQTKGCLGKHLYDCTYTEVYWFSRLASHPGARILLLRVLHQAQRRHM